MENKVKVLKKYLFSLVSFIALVGIFLYSCSGSNNTGPSTSLVQGIPSAVFDVYVKHNRGKKPNAVYVYVKQGGNGDGSSWDSALPTLTAGMAVAESKGPTSSKVVLVLVAAGTYSTYNVAMKNNIAIIGGWSGSGWGLSGRETILSGDKNYRVFRNTFIGRSAILYGVTIKDGWTAFSGGGMLNFYASPNMYNVVFKNNRSADVGGGMFNFSSDPWIENVYFIENHVNVYNHISENQDVGFYYGVGLRGVNLTIGRGTANTEAGGGMYNVYSSPDLRKVKFSGNTVGNKIENEKMKNVALYKEDYGLAFKVMLHLDVAFGDGGDYFVSTSGSGMYNYQRSRPTMRDVIFSKNKGGNPLQNAVFSYVPVMENVTFIGNTSK